VEGDAQRWRAEAGECNSPFRGFFLFTRLHRTALGACA
jgi:hypothetical protein